MEETERQEERQEMIDNGEWTREDEEEFREEIKEAIQEEAHVDEAYETQV